MEQTWSRSDCTSSIVPYGSAAVSIKVPSGYFFHGILTDIGDGAIKSDVNAALSNDINVYLQLKELWKKRNKHGLYIYITILA